MEKRQISCRFYSLELIRDDRFLLDAWLNAFGWAVLIDKRTAAWRHRPSGFPGGYGQPMLQEFLIDRPDMLKTPIIEAGDAWLLGWNAPNKVRLLGHLHKNHQSLGLYDRINSGPILLM
ncbi:MAG: hypothetical protein EXR08_06650 [Alphaproteobacteria bacterium]|nr:hypothetical protein [Alphaproteobacteria bacterium]